MFEDYKNMKPGVDKDYFKKFPEEMMERLKDADLVNIEEEAPVLFSLKKAHGFRVPDNYFENFELREFPKVQNRASIINMNFISAIAAGMILLLAALLFLRPASTENIELAEFDEIDSEILFDEIFEDEEGSAEDVAVVKEAKKMRRAYIRRRQEDSDISGMSRLLDPFG